MRKCWPRNCGRNNTFISVSPPQDSGSGLNLRWVLRITFIFRVYLGTCSSFLVCDTKNQLTVSFTWNARLSNSTKEWQNQGCYFNNLSDSLKFCESGPGASQHSHSDTQTGGDISRFVNTFTIHMWWEKCTVSFCRNQQKGPTDSSSDPIMIYDFAVINNSGQSVLKPQ